MKLRKIILMLTFALLICLTGCKKTMPYNARIINDNYEFNEEYIIENKTLGAYLNNGDIADSKYPEERMIIINDETSFKNAFKTFEKIDFTKEMIVMHAFTTASNSEYELKNIKYNEKKLTIEYITKKTNGINPPNASKPDTKWLIVKLDSLDIDEVNFVFCA